MQILHTHMYVCFSIALCSILMYKHSWLEEPAVPYKAKVCLIVLKPTCLRADSLLSLLFLVKYTVPLPYRTWGLLLFRYL